MKLKRTPRKAQFIEAVEFGGADRRRQQGDAEILAALGGKRILDHPVVHAVYRGLHDDAALDAEHVVQCEQRLLGGVARIERRRRGEGILLLRPDDMTVRVPGAGRQAQRRFTRIEVVDRKALRRHSQSPF
jgi:hypothetical protein